MAMCSAMSFTFPSDLDKHLIDCMAIPVEEATEQTSVLYAEYLQRLDRMLRSDFEETETTKINLLPSESDDTWSVGESLSVEAAPDSQDGHPTTSEKHQQKRPKNVLDKIKKRFQKTIGRKKTTDILVVKASDESKEGGLYKHRHHPSSYSFEELERRFDAFIL